MTGCYFPVSPDSHMRHLTTTVAFLVVIASCGCVSTVSREALIQKASRYDLTSWPDVKRTTTLELNLWMIQEAFATAEP